MQSAQMRKLRVAADTPFSRVEHLLSVGFRIIPVCADVVFSSQRENGKERGQIRWKQFSFRWFDSFSQPSLAGELLSSYL